MKICTVCNKRKSLKFFNKHKDGKNGLNPSCKKCVHKKYKLWYIKNKVRQQKYAREYRKKNKSYLSRQKLMWARSNPKKVKDIRKRFYKKHKERLLRKFYLWKKYNKRKYYMIHRNYQRSEKGKIRKKIWINLNKNKVYKWILDWQNKKRKADPLFRLAIYMRNRTRFMIKHKGYKKNHSTQKYIGCSNTKLKKHLEKKFQKGMSWKNYGRNGWHVDHIKPLSKAKTKKELLKRCHYTNLQPLWELDNIIKSNK